MLTLLLAAALTVPVAFPDGMVVAVPMRRVEPEDLFTAGDPRVIFNRDRSAAVVQRCVIAPKNSDWCDLWLVRPDRQPLGLKAQGGVVGLVWTPDGRYLVARSDSSLRLWNLRGAVRGVVPGEDLPTGQGVTGRRVQRVWFSGRLLCVTAEMWAVPPSDLYPSPTSPGPHTAPMSTRLQSTFAYRWPALTPAEGAACRHP